MLATLVALALLPTKTDGAAAETRNAHAERPAPPPPADCSASARRGFERSLLAIGDYTEARIAVDKFVTGCAWDAQRLLRARDAPDVEFRVWRGAAQEDLGDLTSAAVEYCEASRIEPEQVRVSERLAVLQAQGAPHCDALTNVTAYLRAHPSGLPREQRDRMEFARRQGWGVQSSRDGRSEAVVPGGRVLAVHRRAR